MSEQEQTVGGAGGASGAAAWPHALPQDDPRHGTGTGYSYWGCRCETCADGKRRYSRDYYRRRRQFILHDTCPSCGGKKYKLASTCRACYMQVHEAKHGTASRYNNQGCRCDACRAASTEKLREYRHRTGRSRPVLLVRAERRAAAEARDNHGTETRYNSGGCRCRECRDAVALARRLRRQRATSTPEASPA